MVLLGAEDFVATLVQRFGLLDFFELRRVGEASAAAEASYDPQQASALAEGFFRLVLEVVTNRAMISSEHALRKQIIQWLAAGQQMTHSKLIKQITYEKIAKKGTHTTRHTRHTRCTACSSISRDQPEIMCTRGGTDPGRGGGVRAPAGRQAGLLPTQARVRLRFPFSGHPGLTRLFVSTWPGTGTNSTPTSCTSRRPISTWPPRTTTSPSKVCVCCVFGPFSCLVYPRCSCLYSLVRASSPYLWLSRQGAAAHRHPERALRHVRRRRRHSTLASRAFPYLHCAAPHRDLRQILQVLRYHSATPWLTHRALERSLTGWLGAESVLDGALHLLMLCLRRETTDRADACARDVSVDVREDESNPCSALKHPAGDGSSSSADVNITAGPFSLLDRLKLKVRSDDVGGNQGEEGEEASSMLELLIKLRKASEQQDRPLGEEKPFLDELLRVVRAMDDECARVIDASFEDASRESKAKTARERARYHTQALVCSGACVVFSRRSDWRPGNVLWRR